MKKMFKKSIACLIAVLMVVSAMPFTALTAYADTASDKAYIQENYKNGAPEYATTTSTSGNALSNHTGYMNNILVSGSYTADVNSAQFSYDGSCYFSIVGHALDSVVAIYDGANTVKIPVSVEAKNAHTSNAAHTYAGIDHVALKNGGQFSLGNDTWIRANGWVNYGDNRDTSHDFSTDETFNKTRANNSTGYFEACYTSWGVQKPQSKQWKNYITFTPDSSFNTNYYASLTTLAYKCQADMYVSWTGGSGNKQDTTVDTSDYAVNYKVINYAPLKSIMNSQELKDTFEKVSANEGNYKSSDVAAYYSAVAALFRFNLTDGLTVDTVSSKAAEIKTLVDNYNAVKDIKEIPEYTYTFVKADGSKTTVEAENDSTAYFWAVTAGNVPNTAATTKTFAGNHQHKWVEYSWPTSATNYTFTEVATENFEACTEETTSEHKDATCTENGYDKETTTCSVCGNEDVKTTNIDATGHKMVYTRVDFDSHTKKCANGDIEETTEAHNFVDGVCEDCGAEEVDLTAYNKAVASLTAELEKTDIYTADSIADAKSELDTVTAMFNMGVVTTQAQVDSLTARLVTAQESLVRSNYVITFVIDKDGETTETTSYLPYGFVANLDAGTDSVLKWTVEAQNGTTKLGTTDRVLDYVVARDAVVTAYVTADADTETEQYSKVTFIGHNRAVVEVKYVKVGEIIETKYVDAPVISFYDFKGWDKETVTGTGADITVTAEYEAQGTEKCNVVFGDFQKDYDYDAFVYLTDADENTRYAMYDANDNLLTYFVGKSFYVPHTDKVVIKEAGDEDVATSAITGYYKDGTSLVYNAKFYLPEGATLVKAGVEVTVGNKTVPFYADKVSSRNEYSYAIDFGSLTGVEVSARSFVVYKTADGEPQTVYSSTTVSQTL